MSKIAEDETDDSFLDLFDLEMRRFFFRSDPCGRSCSLHDRNRVFGRSPQDHLVTSDEG